MIGSFSSVWLWPPITTSMPGTCLGQAHVLALAEAPVLAFLHAAMAERDDHVDLLRLAQHLHHLLGGLDRVGERRGAAAGVDMASLPSTPKRPKRMPPRSITRWRRITPSLARRWRSASVASSPAKLVFEASTAGIAAGLGRDADGLAQAVGPEVEFMVAEGGGVVAHPAISCSSPPVSRRRGAERRAHAVVARVEHQHRALALARLLPLRDQTRPGARSRRASCRR